MNEVIITTASGSVKGVYENEFLAFKGIPYAKADRFMAPRAYRWNNVLDCTSFGKKAMQVYDSPMPWMPKQDREEFDEDCLNLNIYIPKGTTVHSNLPVLVEVHGGAYQSGSNQKRKPEEIIKEEKIIYVAINYRLGALGYLYLGGLLGDEYQTSGNNGLLDQLAAVRWIYKNIGCFGGDPERITVLGSSAGAKSIGALMMIPEFNDYVKQVILSSGATQSIRSVATSEITTSEFMDTFEKMADSLGYSKEQVNPQTLLTMSEDDIIKIQKVFCDNPGNTCTFGPVADGVIIKDDWKKVAMQGTAWAGKAMIGSSRNELGFYKFFEKDFLSKAPDIANWLFGINGKIAIDEYQRLEKEYEITHGQMPEEGQKEDIWVRILTDYMYRLYSSRLAERLYEKDCKVWQYSVELLPALHCFDQSIAFREPDPFMIKSEEARENAKKVGKYVWRSFMNFIENGNPSVGPENMVDEDSQNILKDWKPLSVRSWKAMFWDVDSQVKTIPENDVLDRFPEEVYIRG